MCRRRKWDTIKEPPIRDERSLEIGFLGVTFFFLSLPAGDDPSAPTSKSIPPHFTAETLAIAVASAAIGALILGFITGFFCGKKCNKEEDNQLYAVTDYEYYDQRQNANRYH